MAGTAAPAAAQDAPASASSPTPTPTGATFLPRADFTFVWAGLLTDDPRFDWQGQLHFDLDVTDYGRGRVRFVGGYEADLGRERHRYDLNQGTFLFEASGTRRTRAGEVAAVIAHVSRHLVDRENQPAISWNQIGGRLRGEPQWRTVKVEAQAQLAFAMQQAFVDYRWLADAEFRVRRPIARRLEVGAGAAGVLIGVDPVVARRDRQCGARLEGHLRVNGEKGALELFAGYERRIDAYPTDRQRTRYFTIGFRVTTEK